MRVRRFKDPHGFFRSGYGLGKINKGTSGRVRRVEDALHLDVYRSAQHKHLREALLILFLWPAHYLYTLITSFDHCGCSLRYNGPFPSAPNGPTARTRLCTGTSCLCPFHGIFFGPSILHDGFSGVLTHQSFRSVIPRPSAKGTGRTTCALPRKPTLTPLP